MMSAILTKHLPRFLNIGLRASMLFAKLGLTLYMGRYLSLSDIGTYGLAFGTVMILTTVLGIWFDYIVSRELVRTTPSVALIEMRNQTSFYLLNHLIAAVVMGVVISSGVTGFNPRILVYILLLTVADNYSNLTSSI